MGIHRANVNFFWDQHFCSCGDSFHHIIRISFYRVSVIVYHLDIFFFYRINLHIITNCNFYITSVYNKAN